MLLRFETASPSRPLSYLPPLWAPRYFGATCSQEKLSQVRWLASAGSRAAQELPVLERLSSPRNIGLFPLLLPLQLLSQFLQGTEVRLPKGASLKTMGNNRRSGGAPAQSQQSARGQGVSNKASIDGSTTSLPPIPPTLGGGGSTFLDIPGLMWDTQDGIAQKGLFPVGGRLSFFLPALQRITSTKFVLEVIRQGYTSLL